MACTLTAGRALPCKKSVGQGGAGSILVGLVGLAMLIYAVYVLVTV